MHQDLGISFAALGLTITLINASGAIAQLPIGFLVDRFGAKLILILGLLVKTFSIGAMALTSSYEIFIIFLDLNSSKQTHYSIRTIQNLKLKINKLRDRPKKYVYERNH